ncbi:MAG: type II and III secretion system protein [Burkholderiales bacterium]|nr:type II and III secretion system protein [Burkholderiales bacterium]
MKPSAEGHLKAEPAPPSAAIPAPVQLPPAPPKPRPAERAETYSVVVNNVKVHELLFALARDAKLNIDIHPGITGTVTLNAIDQTLPQLLNRISKQVDMRYELDGPNLLVMPDSPYLRVYKIDYVNMLRDTTGQVSVSAQLTGTTGAGAGAGASGGGQNVSSLQIRNVSNNRFWETLVENVKDVLRETDKILPTGGAVPAPAPAPAPAPGAAAGQQPGLQVASAAPTPSVSFREAASVIANPEAGVLFVRATSRQHEKLQEFLDQVLVNARRQVLIEATIVEVLLNNTYEQGIDWSYVGRTLMGFSFAQTQVPRSPAGTAFTMAYNSNVFNATLRLLETFGTTRIISSPRISAVNNQTAVIKVVENVVYFLVQSQISQATNAPSLQSVTTTPQTVPVGLVMNITPQISQDDSILLNVKPSISAVAKMVQDPNPQLTIQNNIPQVATREMESVLKMTSGQIAVLGGLIQDKVANTDQTVPGVNRIPLLGNLFANRDLQSQKTELVIFLRPTVVHDPSLEGDFRGYRVFLPGEDFMSRPNPGRPVLPDAQVQ